MKKIYLVYAFSFVLLLVSGILLAKPPVVFAADCHAVCKVGSDIFVSGSTCSCTDNQGCTWTGSDGKQHSQNCATELELD